MLQEVELPLSWDKGSATTWRLHQKKLRRLNKLWLRQTMRIIGLLHPRTEIGNHIIEVWLLPNKLQQSLPAWIDHERSIFFGKSCSLFPAKPTWGLLAFLSLYNALPSRIFNHPRHFTLPELDHSEILHAATPDEESYKAIMWLKSLHRKFCFMQAISFGCTVMIPLGRYAMENRDYAPHKLLSAIEAFRGSVEVQFPGLYTWLTPESYHVTLRAIH